MRATDVVSPLARHRRRTGSPYLVEWDARDGTTQPRTGQTPTFTRASSGGYIDSRGCYRVAPYGRPRFGVERLGGLFGLLVEPERVNYCKASEAIGDATYWIASNIASSADVSAAGLTLQRLTDSTEAAEGYAYQTVNWGTTGGEVGLSVCVRRGTAPSCRVLLYSGANTYVLAVVTWDGVDAPVVTMSSGSFLGAVRMADGVWRILFRSVGATAASSARVYVAPAALPVGQTGYTDVGAVQVERLDPSSYIRNIAGATNTRARDHFRIPLGWATRDLTVCAQWARPAHVGLAMSSFYRSLVNVGNERALLYDAGAGGIAGYGSGTIGSLALLAYAAGGLGDAVDAVVRVRNVRESLYSELETAHGSATGPLAGANLSYPYPAVGIGCYPDPAVAHYEFGGLLSRVAIRAGAWSLAQMMGGG